MSGITPGGIRYPDASSRAQNLGAELKRMAEDIEAMFFAEGDSFHKGTLAASHNLDLVLDAGSYGYWAGNPNNPHGVSGVLLVMPMSTNTVQIAYSYASLLVSKRFRSAAAGAWSAWERIDGRVFAPRLSEPGIDANTIDDDIVRYSTATFPIANLPDDAAPTGRLTTSVLIPTSTRPKLQEYVTTSPPGYWTRFSGPSGWAAWTRLDADAIDLSGIGTGVGVSPAGFKTVPLACTVGGGQASSDADAAGAVRFPLRFAARIQRYRVHIVNINPRFGAFGASKYISGVWMGTPSGTAGGAAAWLPRIGAPGQISAISDGEPNEYITPWNSTPLEANTDYLLSFGYSGTGTAEMNVGGAYVSPIRDDAYNNSGTGSWTRATRAPFSVWIEAEVAPDVPVVAAFGDSLSSGVGATLPVYDSWLSRWCRDNGALPVHYTASGDTMAGWGDPTHYKWQRWQHLSRPDAVVHAMGSNDVFAAGRTLAELQTRRAASMTLLRTLVSPTIYSATIMPRDAVTGDQEDLRRSYNDWLKLTPDAARDVFDFSAAISDNDESINPGFNADGIHLNTAGYAALAASVDRPIVAGATQ